MKKILPIIFTLLSFVAFAQNRYSKVTTSSFKPMSLSEISNVSMTLQKRYNANQKYLYNMKKWILELKPQIKEKKFINRLNGEYSVLTSMEDDDLGRAAKALKQRENSIREIISEYNTWINIQNNDKTRTTESTQSSNEQNNIEVSNSVGDYFIVSASGTLSGFPNIHPYTKTFIGTQIVPLFSPILEKPDMFNSKQIGKALNSSVRIIEKYNNGYYKVNSEGVEGYLWVGWFEN